MQVFYRVTDNTVEGIQGEIAREFPLTIFVNQQELATLLCIPNKLGPLVLGFLYLEGIIKDLQEVLLMRLCEEEGIAEVRLVHEPEIPSKRIYTSGCGRGVVFGLDPLPYLPVESEVKVEPEDILPMMKALYARAEVYRSSGGVHASALSNGAEILVIAEDVGRNNTLDKIQGECLLRDISTEGKVLLTTGRISSEMLLKAAKMRIPLLISRTSPTDLAVKLADKLNITLIGYARGKSFTIYSRPFRVMPQDHSLITL